MPNLFVLVATGQIVSNLPPVLELAEAGDQMLWIESPQAARGDWRTLPEQFLHSKHLTTAEVISVPDINDPVGLATAVSPFVETHIGRYRQVYVVANGGQKLTPLGLIRGLAPLKPVLIYGNDRPAGFTCYPDNLESQPQLMPYRNHQLDLPDILASTGHVLANPESALRIWPDGLTPEILAEPYGQDEHYTYSIHEQKFAAAQLTRDPQRVSYELIESLIPEQWRKWQRSLRMLMQSRRLTPQMMSNVYYATLNLDAAARTARDRQTQGFSVSMPMMGPALENAVARRVYQFLSEQPNPCVRSVWLGPEIARAAVPGIKEAECDLVIVMTNGVLIHLECKSAVLNPRDLDRNTFRLREAASRLAVPVVVSPYYTRCLDQPWHHDLEALRASAQTRKLSVVPFTWPDQPELSEQPRFRFEERLADVLAPYSHQSPS